MELVVLTENFNKGLMNESEEETEEVTSSNDDNSRDLELSSAEEAEKYYNNYSLKIAKKQDWYTHGNLMISKKAILSPLS